MLYNEEFFIKPENDRESELWGSGWRCGMITGIGLSLLAIILIIFCATV